MSKGSALGWAIGLLLVGVLCVITNTAMNAGNPSFSNQLQAGMLCSAIFFILAVVFFILFLVRVSREAARVQSVTTSASPAHQESVRVQSQQQSKGASFRDLSDVVIDPEPVKRLLRRGGHDNPIVDYFVKTYMLPVKNARREQGQIVVTTWEHKLSEVALYNLMQAGANSQYKPTVEDPFPYLNDYLYRVERDKTVELQMPHKVIAGFSNCGKGFYREWVDASQTHRDWMTSMDFRYRQGDVAEGEDGELRWIRPIKTGTDELYRFLFYLNRTAFELALDPIVEP